ncbi:MAG: OmpH family outer membrane protein [Ferruginibacter sp.]
MKQLSIVLNVVLIVAVGLLYYFHFSEKKPVDKKNVAAVSSNAEVNTSNMTRPAIAYVDLDSLNEKITYIKNRRKELEGEQQAIDAEWESGYTSLQNKRDNFLKKGTAAIKDEEMQQFQNELLGEKQQIDDKKQALSQKLNEKSYKFMDNIQKQLKEFLADYNKEKNYMYIFTAGSGLDYMVYKDSTMNITPDVIEGMNKKMSTATPK